MNVTEDTDFEVHAPLVIWDTVANFSRNVLKESMGAEAKAVVELLKVKLEHQFGGWGIDVTLYDGDDDAWIAVMFWKRP